MAARHEDGRVILDGALGVDEAEGLLALLVEHPDAPLDLGGCERIHTAVLQVLLAARRPLSSPPSDAQLARLLETSNLGRDGSYT